MQIFLLCKRFCVLMRHESTKVTCHPDSPAECHCFSSIRWRQRLVYVYSNSYFYSKDLSLGFIIFLMSKQDSIYNGMPISVYQS